MSEHSRVTSMAHAGVMPWHGNSTLCDPSESNEVWLERAGLGGTMVKKPMYVKATRDGLADVLVGNFSSSEDRAKGKGADFALYRLLENGELNINRRYQFVSEDYQITQDRELLNFFQKWLDSGDMQIETLGSLDDGGIIWCLAKINHGTDFELPGGDLVKGYIALATSHTGKISFVGFATTIRIVCANTWRGAYGGAKNNKLFSIKHSMGAENKAQVITNAQEVLDVAIKQMHQARETAEFLTSVPASPEVVNEFVYRVTNEGRYLLTDAIELTEAAKAAEAEAGSILDFAVVNSENIQRTVKVRQIPTAEDMNRQGKQILDAIITSPGNGLDSCFVNGDQNWWRVLNGVTYQINHMQGRSSNTRQYQAWYGNGASQIEAATKLAVEYAQNV